MKINYLSKIRAFPKDLRRNNNRKKKKNTYLKSDNSKFETTMFNNQNTLLFSRNYYINSHDKIENNFLVANNEFSDRFIKKDEANFIARNLIYTPVNMSFKTRTLNETIYREYFHISAFKNFQIENFEIFYKSNKINKPRMKFKIFELKKRFFIFPTNKKVFTCQQISIINPPILDYLAIFINSQIKTIIIFLIYLYIWLYLLVFIQSIYKQFGKNIIKICVMPLISMLFIKLTITFNVMMFLTTFILYLWGDYFIKTSKLPFIQMIIFKGLVPPLAFHHYIALRNFLELLKNNRFSNLQLMKI